MIRGKLEITPIEDNLRLCDHVKKRLIDTTWKKNDSLDVICTLSGEKINKKI